MFELSINEDIQNRARESIQKVLKNYDCLNYDALNEMEYLQQCIDGKFTLTLLPSIFYYVIMLTAFIENFRKYPPVPNVTRVANKDYPIANTNMTIEKGISIICPIYSIHTDPEIYPEPERYDPDRFTREEVNKRHSFSFLPFGHGPRSCIAPRYANIMLKIALVKILTEFEFKLDRTKTKVPLKMAPEKLVFWPNEEVVINFHKISIVKND